MTQRITARKVECGNVGKMVARREIEMIKKRGWIGRSSSFNGRSLVRSRLEKGRAGIRGTFSDLTIDFVQKSRLSLNSYLLLIGDA